MLTVEDVDRYLTIGEDSVCLVSGDESACITLLPETDDESRPVIHIHPSKLIYVFYREGVPIIQAEIVTDTPEIMAQVKETVADAPPQTDDDTQQEDDETSQPELQPTTLEGVSGDNQSAEINQPLADPLIVRVRDQNGDVLSGVTVTFSVSPSGTLSPQRPTTDVNGEASTELVLGSTPGSYTVTATVSGISEQVTFTATAVRTPSNTISVHGGTSAPLSEIGVIDLRIRTEEEHEVFECGAGYRQLDVTAYRDSARTQERAYQHWDACIDADGNVTIFLLNHEKLTCAEGPNTHYLVIKDGDVKVTEADITIRELVQNSGNPCQ